VTEISDGRKVFLKVVNVGLLHYITTEGGGASISDIKETQYENAEKKVSRVGFSLWRDRLGHLNEDNLQKMKVIKIEGKPEECETSCKGKMKRSRFPSGEGEKATKVLERIHSDVVGPISPWAIGKAR
jgi:hypothetical protein